MDQDPTDNHDPSREASGDVITILVCSTCREPSGIDTSPRPGEVLGDATRDALGDARDIRVLSVECLGNCKRRLSAAILKPGAWSYVFGDLSTENGPDLIAGARLYASAPEGIMPWRGRPDCLKRGLVARIPFLPSSKDIQ